MKAFLYQELLADLLSHLKSECLTAKKKKKKSMLIAKHAHEVRGTEPSRRQSVLIANPIHKAGSRGSLKQHLAVITRKVHYPGRREIQLQRAYPLVLVPRDGE